MPDLAEELDVIVDDVDPDEGDPAASGEDDEAPAEADDGLVGADPVRLYLKQMGQASLLSREGEVEIAKRIEEGEHHELCTALATPLGLRRVLGFAERLRVAEIDLRDLVKEENDEDAEQGHEDARQRTRFLAQLGRLRRIVAEREAVLGASTRRLNRSELARRAARLARFDARLATALVGLGLARRQVALVIDELSRAAERVTRLQARIRQLAGERPRARA